MLLLSMFIIFLFSPTFLFAEMDMEFLRPALSFEVVFACSSSALFFTMPMVETLCFFRI